MEIEYNNLGQMLEGRLVYFRSTDIEQMNYERLLYSVPDEWFVHFINGNKIVVNDISIKARGKVERIFLPVLQDVINYLLFDTPPQFLGFRHHFYHAIQIIDNNSLLKTKFKFWRGENKNLCINYG
jgi:hypothetical protein